MAIVVKIGTNTLMDGQRRLDPSYICDVARQVFELKRSGKDVLIVSSGAIGAGTIEMGYTQKVREIPLRQAMAAIGQGLVMKEYHDAFSTYGIKVAQILLTYDDFSNRSRFLNLSNALSRLLKMGVVPILNENDPISTKEIEETFGDNDKLSALVASKIGAEKLIILSDIDGLYDSDPKINDEAKLVKVVEVVDESIEAMCGKKGSTFSTGGMISKITAVKIASAAGVTVCIRKGREKDALLREDLGTVFMPHKTVNQKKHWIREAKTIGTIHVDDGARDAMLSGRNLLPAGVLKIEGTFDCDSIVLIKSDGKAFAKAIVDYSSDSLLKMIGRKKSELPEKIRNVIKRENLVMI